MLTPLVLNANALSGLGPSLQNRLFTNSGWLIPNDTDAGIYFDAGVEGGGGLHGTG